MKNDESDQGCDSMEYAKVGIVGRSGLMVTSVTKAGTQKWPNELSKHNMTFIGMFLGALLFSLLAHYNYILSH
jgi:hypothetical protein